MRVVHLETENVKRIKAVAVTPQGDLITIGGKNEEGKTSLIDSLEYGLHGGKSLPAEPLRRGTKRGSVKIDLGDLTVERTFTKKTSTLTVTPKNGLPFPSPQSVLDKLYADHTFDPLGFMQKKPKEQQEFLRKILGLDFTALEVERLRLYNERFAVNREAKSLEAQVESIEFEQVSPVSTEELLVQIETGDKHNASIDKTGNLLTQAQAEVARAEEDKQRYEAEIEELRQKATTLRSKIAQSEERANVQGALVAEYQEEIDGFTPTNTAPMKAKLNEAAEINAKVKDQEWRRNIETQARAKNAEGMKLTLAIEEIDEKKAMAIAAAKFPVEGLAFSDDGVLFDNLPFEQASGEQQIIVSAAMALAQNPKLRILLIRNGSLLDAKHREILANWATENDCQVWLEIVSDTGVGCSVVISDGMVVTEGEPNAA